MAFIVFGCGATEPTASAARLSPTFDVSPDPTVSQTMAPEATASVSIAPEPGPVSFDIQTIDPQYTTPLLETATDGTSIIWSSGAQIGPNAAYAPDLYYYTPGGPEPRVVFESANRDANLIPIKASHSQFAFAESLPAEGGLSLTWRAWHMAGPDSEPVLIDEADGPGAAAGPIPFFDIDNTRVVWTAFHGADPEQESQILLREHESGETMVLRSASAAEEQFWFVDLDADRLVYGTVEFPSSGPEERHVYLLDLGDPTARPQRLDESGLAAMPQIAGDVVVWKETDPEFHLLNAGTLVTYSLASEEIQPVDFGTPGLNYPSLGDRFVAAWIQDATVFNVYDLRAAQPVEVLRFPRIGDEAVVRPTIAGSLLVFSHVPADAGALELQWALID